MQLEEARDYLKHKYTAGVRCLEEAVKRLELDASSNTDSHHLHHLQQSLVSLQAGAHFLASPSIPDCFPFFSCGDRRVASMIAFSLGNGILSF
jgi:hypothetical protein